MIFKNRMKQSLKEGKVVFGPMVSEIRSPGIALLLAQAGFDFFFIDMEHSCFTMETMSDMVLSTFVPFRQNTASNTLENERAACALRRRPFGKPWLASCVRDVTQLTTSG